MFGGKILIYDMQKIEKLYDCFPNQNYSRAFFLQSLNEIFS